MVEVERRPVESVGQQPWLLFARLVLGAGWVVEATIGRFWKWGWFGSGVNPDWLGDTAGAGITATAQTAQKDGVWPWYSWVLDNVVLNNAEFWSWVTSITQVMIGVALILGLFTRFAALSGLAMLVSILLMGSFRTSPLLLALTLFVLLVGSERFGALDQQLLANRSLHPLATLGLDGAIARFRPWLAIIVIPIGTYFVLQQATRPAARFIYVGLEFAVFSFAVAAAVVMSRNASLDRVTIATGLLRMYVGYKMLWWVWTAPQASLTSLPGFNDGTALAEVFATGAESHLPLLSSIVDSVFGGAASFWAVVFGLAQVIVGFLLLVGWKVRAANIAAVALFAFYIVIGFTRYAPYLGAMAVITMGLGSAPRVSLARLITGRTEPSKGTLRLTRPTTAAVSVAAVVLVVAAIASGITPNGYSSDVGSTVLWTFGLNISLLAAAAVFAVRNTGPGETIDLRSSKSEPAADTARSPNLAPSAPDQT